MKLLNYLIILLLAGTGLLYAQPSDFTSGLILEDEVYDQLPRQSEADGAKANLPSKVDLTPYCPEVRHQGYIYSCVGWATGYGAMTIQRAILNRCTDRRVITNNAYSALFLYNQIKVGDCQRGSRISDALSFLNERGDCLAKHFDFDVNNCQQQPTPDLQQHARRYAIEDFVTLFGSKDDPALKVLQVRKMLAQKRPVVIGMKVLRNFYELKQAKVWWPQIGNTTPAGGHAMVVVGYDDRKEAFRLFNSWGKAWGDNGYIWIKYKDFGQFCKYGFVLYLIPPNRSIAEEPARPVTTALPKSTPREKPLVRMAGSFSFQHFLGYSPYNNQPQFETAPVKLAGKSYQTERATWSVGQLFQLAAINHMQEAYLYVFSIDAQKNIHFHWPRQQQLNPKFAGKNESALFVAAQSEARIPGKTRALQLAHPGTDRLIVLFSKKRIRALPKLAQILANSSSDFTNALWHALGKYAVPPTDIHYAPDQMRFEVATRGDGYIVPIVLEVKAE